MGVGKKKVFLFFDRVYLEKWMALCQDLTLHPLEEVLHLPGQAGREINRIT